MQKALEIKLTVNDAGRIEAGLAKCDAALRRIFKDMKKDQTEIERLKAKTRMILAELKAA